MRTVLLLRHAKSSHADSALADHDRPLAERGRRAAPRMGRLLVDAELVPDAIISSTARRTQETAELLAEECAFEGPLLYDERLYLASSRTIAAVLSRSPARFNTILIVGHNPGLEDLVRRLTRRDETMPTAALAHIELPIDAWHDLDLNARGALRQIWRPRELDSEAEA